MDAENRQPDGELSFERHLPPTAERRTTKRWLHAETAETCEIDGIPVPTVFRVAFAAGDAWAEAIVRCISGELVTEAICISGQIREIPKPHERRRKGTADEARAGRQRYGSYHQVTLADLTLVGERLDAAIEWALESWPRALASQKDPSRSDIYLWSDSEIQADSERLQRAYRAQQGKRLDVEDLKEVARIYRENPDRPRKAVAEQLHIADVTASKRIRKARDAGLLEEPTGKAG